MPGQVGSVYWAASPAVAEVVSIAPTGTYTAAVSTAEVVFSAPVNPYSVVSPGVLLTTPEGVIVSNITSTALSPYRFALSFDVQTAQGDYVLSVGPQVVDLYGQPLSQVYTGLFAIAWTTVGGSITDTNGLPMPDVMVQSDRGGEPALTDANGNYVLAVPPGGVVTVTPSKSGLMFVPASRSYTDVTVPITNENYLAVGTTLPTLTTEIQTNDLILSWYGLPGVSYQAYYSTDLAVWLPYDNPLLGTNGLLQFVVPMGTDPLRFFRVQALY
jgi:hypothetical protein